MTGYAIEGHRQFSLAELVTTTVGGSWNDRAGMGYPDLSRSSFVTAETMENRETRDKQDRRLTFDSSGDIQWRCVLKQLLFFHILTDTYHLGD